MVAMVSETPLSIEGENKTAEMLKVARYRRRLQMLMRALYTIGGKAMRNSFAKQQELLRVCANFLTIFWNTYIYFVTLRYM